MPKGAKLEKKNAYFAKLVKLVGESPLALIVDVDNVGSLQMQNIRIALRGKCELLMGKNTMIRTALRQEIARLREIDENDEHAAGLERLVAAVGGNMGFLFCTETKYLQEARDVLNDAEAGMVLPAAAKAGMIAQCDVFIPAGPTGLDPAQTSFFQALNIPTKIVKGAIELISEFKICEANTKVSMSAAALLAKLGLKPFSFGMKVRGAFQEGSVFDAAVLDITDAIILEKFMAGVGNVAAFSREVGIPTEAALPHMMCNAFKNIVATVAELEFNFKEVEEIKAVLSDPEALAKMQAGAAAAAAAPAAGGAAAGGAAAAAAAPAEEEEDDMEFDLFD